jgi:hypothetical protein
VLLWNVLAFGALPAWLLAGFADWLCHRRSKIEITSGSRESAMHLLLHLEIAAPLLAALWLEINAGLLVLMTACVFAHFWTTLQDTRCAQPVRFISPFEQQVHSWMEMTPLFALVMVAVLNVDAWKQPEWLPVARKHPVPRPWIWLIPLALAGGFALIVEEYARGHRASRVWTRPGSADPVADDP